MIANNSNMDNSKACDTVLKAAVWDKGWIQLPQLPTHPRARCLHPPAQLPDANSCWDTVQLPVTALAV